MRSLQEPSTSRVILWPLAVVLVLLCVLYASVVPPMVAQWNDDPNYSHGFIVPLISGWFLWQSRDALRSVSIRPSAWGFVVVLLALCQLAVGSAAVELFTMRSSLVMLLAGTVLYLFGWAVLRQVSLPVGYLFFMVPLPYILYDTLAFPLKLLVAKYSVLGLKLMGVIVWREGNIIQFPQVVLEVADACSGLRSLLSLIALAVALAFLSHRVAWQRLLVIAAALPIAIVSNMFRVIVTGLLAQHYGAAAAEGFFHEFAGLAVFLMAFILLGLVSALLRRVGA
ncbi:MAG: exosortase [Desulfuromonas sp.]|nr:MAG: exosortase [Desulfuromonas sp.]